MDQQAQDAAAAEAAAAAEQQPAPPQLQQAAAAEQELLALGQHAIDQARAATREAAALEEQARAGGAVAQPSLQLRDVFTRLSELSVSDAAELSRVMQ